MLLKTAAVCNVWCCEVEVGLTTLKRGTNRVGEKKKNEPNDSFRFEREGGETEDMRLPLVPRRSISLTIRVRACWGLSKTEDQAIFQTSTWRPLHYHRPSLRSDSFDNLMPPQTTRYPVLSSVTRPPAGTICRGARWVLTSPTRRARHINKGTLVITQTLVWLISPLKAHHLLNHLPFNQQPVD